MPELLYPGVYVQEIPSGVNPISGVSTSTAAFIGTTQMGPSPGKVLPTGRAALATMVTSFTQYQRTFGGFIADSFLPYAAKVFFDNGGQRLYVVRVLLPGAAVATLGGDGAPLSPPEPADISALNEGAWGNNVWVAFTYSSTYDFVNRPTPTTFKLIVMYGTSAQAATRNVVETYDGVTIASSDPSAPIPANYVGTAVNPNSGYISISTPMTTMPTLPPLGVGPPSPQSWVPQRLSGGSDGSGNPDYIGLPAPDNTVAGTGLYALDKVTDVNLIAIPGVGDPATISAGVDYCKDHRPLQDCFFIADVGTTTPANARTASASTDVPTIAGASAFAISGQQIGGHLIALDSSAGDFGALYYPWIYATDPFQTGVNNPTILLPPSGFVAGIYARTDNSRGVFKAPAGIEAGVASGLAPAVVVSDVEQGTLNPVSVNVIRTVPGSGLVVWGARTFGSDAEWRYVPVRRMAIYLRVSIYYGIQWAVFEPNDEPLWASLRLNIRSFMLTQFRSGAFQGSKPDDAFFVLCDSTTTAQSDIDNGVVNILVGFAPLKPAEFVVLKLTQIVSQSAS